MIVTIDLPDQIVDQLTSLNCGSNSCVYRDRTKNWGVGTNTGCRCLSDLRTETRLPVNRLLDRVVGQIWKTLLNPDVLRDCIAEAALNAAHYDPEDLVRDDVEDAGGGPLEWEDANEKGKEIGYRMADAVIEIIARR